LLNAADAMEPCAAQERVLRLCARRGGDRRVAVEVSDTGRGIAAEHLQVVFEPFWTTRREGLGLGLAICRSIVEAHGGTIGVVPNAGAGTTFRFELPGAASAADAPVEAQPAAAAAGEASALVPDSGPLVCVVDDDAAVRESLVRLLLAEGWPAVPYASATEFLQRQPLAAVGCLLLDNQMPGLSGLELQKCLASDAAAPPVVFLTGHGELSAGVHAMKLGAVDYLVKPVEAAVLSGAVRKALARHALERRRASERAACLARLSRLSARELEVMAHVVRGRLNKQIAADLDIALQTVKQHRSRVMEKMEAHSVPELVQLCEAGGVLPARLP
jgi:FixJ family two-component response regulator